MVKNTEVFGFEEAEFEIINSDKIDINSSIHGNGCIVQELRKEKKSEKHYFSYQVKDEAGDVVGSIIYLFEKPKEAITKWNDFLSGADADSLGCSEVIKDLSFIEKKKPFKLK